VLGALLSIGADHPRLQNPCRSPLAGDALASAGKSIARERAPTGIARALGLFDGEPFALSVGAQH